MNDHDAPNRANPHQPRTTAFRLHLERKEAARQAQEALPLFEELRHEKPKRRAYAVLAALAALAFLTQATAGPPADDDPDFSGGLFGLGATPPAAALPSPHLADEVLGTILELQVDDLEAGDTMLASLGDAQLLFTRGTDDALTTTMVSKNGVSEMVLPAIGSMDPSSFTAFITPATVAIDRPGDNPTETTLATTRDATLNVWGHIEDFGTLAREASIIDAPEVQAPANVQTIATRHKLADPADAIMDLGIVDPEQNVFVGTIKDFTSQAGTEQVFTTANAITTKLQTLAVTGVSLNAVLTSLQQATQPLGIVDLNGLAANLVDNGYVFKTLDLPNNAPGMILDPNNKELVLVDGGLDKIAMVAGQDKFLGDSDLITKLKDADSIKPTRFLTLSTITNGTKRLGVADFHHSLGNFGDLLARADPLLKQGIDVVAMPSGVSCRQQLSQGIASGGKPVFCMLPTSQALPTSGAEMLGGMMRAQNLNTAGTTFAKTFGFAPTNPTAGLPGGPALNGASPLPMMGAIGTPTGALKDIPGSAAGQYLNKTGSVMTFGGMPDKLTDYTAGTWDLPSGGLGSLPDMDALNSDAATLANCSGSCLPSHAPTLFDSMQEMNQAPAVPGLNNVVPTAPDTGALAQVTSATGKVTNVVPVSLLQSLPIGLTSDVKVRAVGAPGSVQGNTGLPEVLVSYTTSDPLGLAKATGTKTTNNNGYASFPAPSLGSYTVQLEKVGFETVSGSGQAPAPGQTSGKEFTMNSATGSKVKDFARDHTVGLVIAAILAIMLVAWANNARKNRKASKTQKRQKGGE